VGIIRLRARNLFETRQLFCSKAVPCCTQPGVRGKLGFDPDAAIGPRVLW
jgi:hypothetical protein